MRFDPMLAAVAMAAVLVASSCSGGEDRLTAIRAAMEKLRPLATKLGKPGPSDWLASHHEPGQTFQEYLDSRPVGPTAERRTLYVQPLGDFTKSQRRIITLTADFMGRYFALPVKINADLPLSLIPAEARRTHPSWGVKQILSTYVLDDVLKPRLPNDAVAFIAFTTSDLWPGEGWNFVFGQASLRDRVGVWSIARNGDPEKEFALCLLRTLKTATHETGHMFSMYHCTLYECNMCGSNHRAESDRRPLALCSECVAKLWWITGADPVERYRKLAGFCKEQGLAPEREFYEKCMETLGKQRR
jgi:archaemetzincin